MSTTRRSVSVTGETYDRLKAHLQGASLSGFTEDVIAEKLDAAGVRTYTPEEAEALRLKNRFPKEPVPQLADMDTSHVANPSSLTPSVSEAMPVSGDVDTVAGVRGGGTHLF